MRTVFTNSMCAHVWAQQTQDHGKSANGNLFFRGPTIYSYGSHFPIARFTKDAHGQTCVLFTTDTYSVSTSRHCSYARSALRGLNLTVYGVHDPESDDREYDLKKRIEHFEERAKQYAKPFAMTWRSEEEREGDLAAIAADIVDFCHAFGLTPPDLKLAERGAAIRDAFAKYNSPQAEAKRAKQATARQIRNARTLSFYHAWIEGVAPIPRNIVGLDRYQKRRVENARAEAKRGLKPQRSVTPEEWIEGRGPSSLVYAWDWANQKTLVRRKGDKLETSRGADVPFAHAVAVFLQAQQCRTRAQAWHTNGHKIRIGQFQLDAIDREGNIQAGCHTIEWSEMLRLALREIPECVKPTAPLPVPLAA